MAANCRQNMISGSLMPLSLASFTKRDKEARPNIASRRSPSANIRRSCVCTMPLVTPGTLKRADAQRNHSIQRLGLFAL